MLIEPNFKALTIKQTIELQKKKLNFTDFIVEFLDLATDFDKKYILELPISKALEFMCDYLLEFYDNPIVTENNIRLLDVYSQDKEVKDINEEEFIVINNYRFTTKLTVAMARQAERRCYLKNHSQFLGLYILASGCLKGLDDGIETIVNLEHIPQNIDILREYNQKINNYSNIFADFLINPEYIILGEKVKVEWSNDFFFFA